MCMCVYTCITYITISLYLSFCLLFCQTLSFCLVFCQPLSFCLLFCQTLSFCLLFCQTLSFCLLFCQTLSFCLKKDVNKEVKKCEESGENRCKKR